MIIPANISQPDFVKEILLRDIENIYKAQRLIISSNIYIQGRNLKRHQRNGSLIGMRTGRLLNSVTNPDYSFSAEGSQFVLSAGYPLYIRFLDMKSLGNRNIYNRQIWGILYNNSLRDLRNNYGREIADFVGESLREAFTYSGKSGEHSSTSDFGADYAKARGR